MGGPPNRNREEEHVLTTSRGGRQWPRKWSVFNRAQHEQTPMNGVQIAFFRDDVPWPGRENLIHEYDRCTITGIWAQGYARTTQGVAKFHSVSNPEMKEIIVTDPDAEFVKELEKNGAFLLFYDKPGSFNRPQIGMSKVVEAIQPRLDEAKWRITLDELPIGIGDDDDIEADAVGADVRIGPNRFADRDAYQKLWHESDNNKHFQGRLGVDNTTQTGRNGIELAFRIEPVLATRIRLPSGARILKFDVTRQNSSTWRILGYPMGLEDWPTGDEMPNDDAGDIDEDNTPNEGWIFCLDAPGAPRPLQIHPPFGTENPIDIVAELDQTIFQDLRAFEFARVLINSSDGFPPGGFPQEKVLGSRCSNKLFWHSVYNSKVAERNSGLRWLKREGENSISFFP